MKLNDCFQSRSQAVGMWQVLVDEGILGHGKYPQLSYKKSPVIWLADICISLTKKNRAISVITVLNYLHFMFHAIYSTFEI